VLYTGNGSTQSITGVGFQPDLLWIKVRNVADSHPIHDVLRPPTGGGKYPFLRPDSTAAEAVQTDNDSLHSLDADGFTVGYTNSPAWNQSGNSYVAWNWKANGSGVSNTDGSITSTVSANTTSGVSVVSYSGAIDGSTVGHGLDQAPELVIFKNRDISSGWFVMGYPTNPNFTADGSYLLLDDTAGMQNSGGNEIEIGSSVITFVDAGSSIGGANSLTDRIIAYCFHSVDGFSKFGSYTGNGSADGPFVYTGFRPAFVMIKRTDASDRWFMGDSTRSPTNTSDGIRLLDASGSDAEFANSPAEDYDMLSNGFKINTSDAGINASGGTYIYMAFSDANGPFKYSNAR